MLVAVIVHCEVHACTLELQMVQSAGGGSPNTGSPSLQSTLQIGQGGIALVKPLQHVSPFGWKPFTMRTMYKFDDYSKCDLKVLGKCRSMHRLQRCCATGHMWVAHDYLL